jgi:hypothetical protein
MTPEFEEEVVARLLVGSAGFANWIGISRYSLDTIGVLSQVPLAHPWQLRNSSRLSF